MESAGTVCGDPIMTRQGKFTTVDYLERKSYGQVIRQLLEDAATRMDV